MCIQEVWIPQAYIRFLTAFMDSEAVGSDIPVSILLVSVRYSQMSWHSVSVRQSDALTFSVSEVQLNVLAFSVSEAVRCLDIQCQ